MSKLNPSITLSQFILLIHGVQMGVGLLTLPRELAEYSGTDSWITIIICWFLSTMIGLIIIQIMKKHPDGTILDLLAHYFGKWVGKLFTLIFALYFGFLTLSIFIREALFIQAWILPRTEVCILAILLAFPSYIIVRKDIRILGRYSEFIFFMTLWLVIIYFMPLKYANWLHLLPIIKEGVLPILTTVKMAIFSFMGFEVAFFLYPYLEKKEKASIGMIMANTLTLSAFLFIVIVSFAFFSPDEITLYSEPPIVMLKVIEFEFIERLEIVFFSFYVFVISTTVLPLLYITVYSSSRLVGKKDHRQHLVLYLLFGIVYVWLFPPTFESNSVLQEMVKQAGLAIAYTFPLLLWGYVSVHDWVKGRAKNEN